MISGAANDSDPQRVFSIGEEEEMNRDRPKSVSLSRGVGRRSSGIDPLSVGGNEKGLTVRMISKHQLWQFILTHSLA
jgi:hypothetical protein